MPLRDHFRPPVSSRVSWEEIHAMWPARIVLQLRSLLPKGYVAGPKIQAVSQVEIDVAAFEQDAAPRLQNSDEGASRPRRGHRRSRPSPSRPRFPIMTSTRSAFTTRNVGGNSWPRSSWSVPATKTDRRSATPSSASAPRCSKRASPFASSMWSRPGNSTSTPSCCSSWGRATLGEPFPHLYAVSCRWRPQGKRMLLQTWSHPLTTGQPLPTLPLWLTGTLAVPLDLEPSYEQACNDLWLA